MVNSKPSKSFCVHCQTVHCHRHTEAEAEAEAAAAAADTAAALTLFCHYYVPKGG